MITNFFRIMEKKSAKIEYQKKPAAEHALIDTLTLIQWNLRIKDGLVWEQSLCPLFGGSFKLPYQRFKDSMFMHVVYEL